MLHYDGVFKLFQGGKYKDGTITHGGYSDGIIGNELFVFGIPDAIPSEDAASMLCAGATVYSPMRRHGVGPGKKVGVVGIGGLVRTHSSIQSYLAELV